MHYIVTGGAGFIGSYLVEELLSQNHKVTVIDNLNTGKLENLPVHPQLQFINKDLNICTAKDFPEAIDGIAHLAAIPSVNESWSQPLNSHHQNISNFVKVIELCKALQIPKLVFASSAAVYGKQSDLPITESSSCEPLSPYGLQKLTCEKYGVLFSQKMNFSFVALRLFNVFGLRQLPDSPYSGVISIFSDAIKHNQPITIYGDGNQTRDFIYVTDVAIAFSKALTISTLPNSSLICNIGTGKSQSLLDLLNVLKTISPQWQQPVKFKTARSGDIRHSQALITKAFDQLNFKSNVSFTKGIKLLVS